MDGYVETRPDLVDAHGNRYMPVHCYVDEDGNLMNRAAIEDDEELAPVVEVAAVQAGQKTEED